MKLSILSKVGGVNGGYGFGTIIFHPVDNPVDTFDPNGVTEFGKGDEAITISARACAAILHRVCI